MLHDSIRDLRHTLRRLARTPGFTIATIATIALGIGANTAIFSVIYSVLLKPLPFPEPDRLIGVWQTAPGVNIADLNPSLADYITYKEHAETFADVAIWGARSATVTEFNEPEFVDGLLVTHRLLPMLGVQPAMGRQLSEKDSVEGSPEVVMLSHGYWQRHYGGDANVIGKTMRIEGRPHEIVGVLPREFWFLDHKHEIVRPLRYDRGKVTLAGYNWQGIARLKPGVTLDQANADVARMIAIEFGKFPPPKGLNLESLRDARLGPKVRLLKQDLLGDIGKSLWVVMATIGIVLLIACANVANLLLVRTEGRAQELAVRTALGAGRGRMARELFVESLVIALVGGAVGIGFAAAVMDLVLGIGPARLPRMEQVSVDGVSVLFTFGLSIVAGLAFGAVPVLKHRAIRVAEALRSGGRTASSGRERNAARNTLTVVQVSLALVLLIGSGLMIRTFLEMRRVDPGFRSAETLQVVRVSVPRTAAEKQPELLMLYSNIVDRLKTIPGVTDASLIGGMPMTGVSSMDPIAASDRAYAADRIPPLRRFFTVAPGTFAALGTRMAAGRELTWNDVHNTRQVVMIGENFAKEYWGSAQAAVGKQIRSNPNDPWSEIIGVVADIRHDGVEKKAPSAVYWPVRSSYSMAVMVRSSRAGTESLAGEIREAIWSVNRSLPVTDTQTMQTIYDKSMSRTAFTLSLLGISGLMALLLAVVGIYAVVSYAVAQRTREIGIRMALGAAHGGLRMMFVRKGLLWSGIGATIGLGAAAVLSRVMSSLLFEISPLDPLTYLTVAAGLLGSAALASYVPARRATRVDPVVALRAD